MRFTDTQGKGITLSATDDLLVLRYGLRLQSMLF